MINSKIMLILLSLSLPFICLTGEETNTYMKTVHLTTTTQAGKQINKTLSIRMPKPQRNILKTQMFFSPNKTWVFNNQNKWLGSRHISNVIVKKLDGKEILKENIDYGVDKNGGKIYGLKDIAPLAVEIDFTSSPERYDAVFIKDKIEEVILKEGKDRKFAAVEHIPVTPDGFTCIARIYIYDDKAEIIPFKKIDIKDANFVEIFEHNKKVLLPFKNKLTKGSKIILAGYGDSITAIQKRGGTIPYAPGGILRDRPELYLSFYPIDIRKKVKLFDFNDGEGKKHCHLGWNWMLKNQIEKNFDVDVEYLNFGIASTNSQSRKPHGLFPERLNDALKSKSDLIVLGFGMNELGAPESFSTKNIINIVRQFQKTGATVIVMGVPRINRAHNPSKKYKQWLKTNQNLKKAAFKTNSAFIPLDILTRDESINYIGISPDSMCATNLLNHPGIYELNKYGELLCAFFYNINKKMDYNKK
jgi:hypothetical protein